MDRIIFFDFETTGLDPYTDYPTELGAKKVSSTGETTYFNELIRLPEGVEVPAFITNLTGLTTEKLQAEGKHIDVVIAKFLDFVGDNFETEAIFVGHNVNFDLGFLYVHFNMLPEVYFCTRSMAILTEPDKNASLQAVYSRFFPEDGTIQEHRATGDVEMTQQVFDRFSDLHGILALDFFVNKLVVMPDRDLLFTPPHARILDFSKNYVAKRKYDELKHRMDSLDK